MDIKIYTTPTCGYCHQAKNFLDQLGVRYTEYDVSRDRAAAQEMVNLTGQMGVPVIVIDGQVVIGFDRNRLRELLSAGSSGNKTVRFGLKIADAAKIAPQMGSSSTSGAIIGEVSPGLLGEKVGLKKGDIITEISGRAIGGAADMERVLAGLKPGNIVTILFRRGTETRKSEIVV
jgi:glutaredoxin 3